MMLIHCKHFSFIVFTQLCFHVLSVSPKSEKLSGTSGRDNVTVDSSSSHEHTLNPHHVDKVTIHSSSHKPLTYKSTPFHKSAYTAHTMAHTTHHTTAHTTQHTTAHTAHTTHHTTAHTAQHTAAHTSYHSTAHPNLHFKETIDNASSHKTSYTVKPTLHSSTPKFKHFITTPSVNMSSDELYVDSSLELSNESKSVSDEIIYANESDIVTNETYWMTLDDAFEILTEKRYDHISAVHALANSYKFFSRKKRFRSLPYGRQHPFIIIEGIDEEIRTTLAEHLVELIEGKLVLNPTSDFHVIYKAIKNITELQQAYITVTTYVAGKNARKAIETMPAVTPGYYLTQAAFVASQLYFPHLPPKNSSFWTWPPDLFKPDMIFFLLTDVDLNPNEELNPKALILKNSLMEIFTLWKNPPCIAIENKLNYSLMLEEMVPHLNTIL